MSAVGSSRKLILTLILISVMHESSGIECVFVKNASSNYMFTVIQQRACEGELYMPLKITFKDLDPDDRSVIQVEMNGYMPDNKTNFKVSADFFPDNANVSSQWIEISFKWTQPGLSEKASIEFMAGQVIAGDTASNWCRNTSQSNVAETLFFYVVMSCDVMLSNKSMLWDHSYRMRMKKTNLVTKEDFLDVVTYENLTISKREGANADPQELISIKPRIPSTTTRVTTESGDTSDGERTPASAKADPGTRPTLLALIVVQVIAGLVLAALLTAIAVSSFKRD